MRRQLELRCDLVAAALAQLAGRHRLGLQRPVYRDERSQRRGAQRRGPRIRGRGRRGRESRKSLTGATWSVESLGSFALADLPVSAVSFDDRLYILGVHTDGSISSLAYAIDGGSWSS